MVTARTDVDLADEPATSELSEEARKAPESFGPDRFINRELSWLEFADRVLELAGAEQSPLLSRAKFLAIFSSGLDEFFQVRVAGLKDQLAVGVREAFPDGRTVLETFAEVRERVRRPHRSPVADLQRGGPPAAQRGGDRDRRLRRSRAATISRRCVGFSTSRSSRS